MTTMITTTSSHPLRRVTAVALAVALVGSLVLALVGAKPAQAALPGQIAYEAKDSSGNYQIYTISPDGNGSPTQVTSDPTNHFYPAYSPNGKTIAYQAAVSAYEYRIYTIPADGNGSPKQLTSGGSPVWG